MSEEERVAICKIIEKEESVLFKLRQGDNIFYREQPFSNYFYVLQEEYDQMAYLLAPKIKSFEEVVDRNNTMFLRIYLKNNFHRNLLRNEIEEQGFLTFEADVTSAKRILIDNPELDLNQDLLKINFFDIEIDDRKNFTYDKNGEVVPLSAITSIACKHFEYEKDGEVFYLRNKGVDGVEFDKYRELRKKLNDLKKEELPTIDVVNELKDWEKKVDDALWVGEKKLLERFFTHIKEFDVVSGWNSRAFDDAYIRFRAKAHKMVFDSLNLVGFDYMECHKKNHYEPEKSNKLQDVAFQELSSELGKENSLLIHPEEIQKIDWREITGLEKYFDLFLLEPEIHKSYNIQDVNLLDMLEKKLHYFRLHFFQTEKSHCMLLDTLYNSRICDIMTLNRCKSRRIIKVSRPTESEIKQREKETPPGGFTFCYKPGLHWGVRCYDFASHYVQVIRTFNISFESYLRTEFPDLKGIFSKMEARFMDFCINSSYKFLDKKNLLKRKKYKDFIEKERLMLENEIKEELKDEKFGSPDFENYKFPTMEELMWRFIREYDQKIDLREDECCTPADVNFDTRGWRFHPHYVFSTKERGIVPEIMDDMSAERDKVKYSLKNYKKGSFEYQKENVKNKGLKTIGNCFSLDTEIMTVDGVKNILDVKKGDKVYSLNLKTREVEEATVIAEIYQENEEDMVHFKNNNTDLLVTLDHNMVKEVNGEFVFCKAKDCLNGIIIPDKNIDENFNITKVDTKHIHKESISLVKPKDKMVACITLDKNNTVLAGRNDTFTWVGQSFYGNFGFRASRDYLVELPSAITTTARYLTKICMLGLWDNGMDITHGDSVSGDSKIFLEDNTKKSIEDLWFYNENQVTLFNSKEIKIWGANKKVLTFCEKKGNIFSKPIQIIRHKVGKKIYKIELINDESIKVTENHSLIVYDDDSKKYINVKPKDIKNGKYKNLVYVNIKLLNGLYQVANRFPNEIEIKSIKEIRLKPTYVYDLSIPKYEKFYANNILVHNTDSTYCVGDKSDDELKQLFKDLLDEKLKVFNTMKINDSYHSVNFEFEYLYEAMIPVKKKRYYYIKDGKIDGKGGITKRSDVIPKAKELQEELLKDIFNKTFNEENWKEKLKNFKEKTFNFELEEKDIKKIYGLGKNIESYGKPLVDGDTGFQKVRKSDNKPMFANVPAGVKLAKKLIEKGVVVNVGDKIPYVVLKEKPKIEAITLQEFRKNKIYDANYYYTRIVRALIEILQVTHKELVYDYFAECWTFTDRQLDNLNEKLGVNVPKRLKKKKKKKSDDG